MITIIGTLAVIASLIALFGGLGHQFFMNWKKGNCDGISRLLIICAFFTYSPWTLYGWVKPDWYLFISKGAGSLIALAFLIQILYFSKKNRKK